MKKRQLMALLLSSFFAASILFTGCSSAGGTAGSAPTAQEAGAAQETEEVQDLTGDETQASAGEESNEETAETSESSNEAAAGAEGDAVTVQILATTDSHGRFLPYNYAINMPDTSGSLAQISTKVEELRKENENTILVDAGDVIQDNSESLFINTEENPMILAMNKIGYDVVTLGNHEFNYGIDALNHVTDQFDGEVLCGNVFDEDGNTISEPYTIVESGGMKIGIIGMVTPNITKWDAANLEGYKVTNPVEETKKAVSELKERGANAIIAVMHVGVSKEYGEDGTSAIEVIDACPEIDAFVAAHFHVKVPGSYCYNSKAYALNSADNTVTATSVDGSSEDATMEEYEEARKNGTVIIEPFKWAQTLGQINIKFTKDDGGNYAVADRGSDITASLIDMSVKDQDPVESDQTLVTELASYNDTAIEDANTVIGTLTGGDLVPQNEIEGIEQAKLQPTAMMTLIHNVQRYYGEHIAGRPIDVSAAAVFQNGQQIKEGDIRKCDTANIYKFDNTLYVLKITGEQLKKYMEWSYSYYNQYKDGDLTISFNPSVPGYNFDMFAGVNYQVDVSKEAGSRIVNLKKADGSDIADDDVLYMTVNNYRANTHLLSNLIFGDGAKPELVAKSEDFSELQDGRVRDLIGTYIQDVKKGEITPEVEENWEIIGNDWDPEQRTKAVKCINDGTLDLSGESNEQTSENSSAVTWDMVKDL